jgi:hypothetical protein
MSLARAVNAWFDDLHGRKTYRRYHEKEQRKGRLASQVPQSSKLPARSYRDLSITWDVWYVCVPFIIADAVLLLYLDDLEPLAEAMPRPQDQRTARGVSTSSSPSAESLGIVELVVAAASVTAGGESSSSMTERRRHQEPRREMRGSYIRRRSARTARPGT